MFFLSMMISKEKTFITETKLDNVKSKPIRIHLAKSNTIYLFEVEQMFSNEIPSYSELEVELLDENFDHVYLMYKDLWQEEHAHDNGGSSIYFDQKIEFEISIKKAGLYHVRVNSLNGNHTPVVLKLFETKGSIYFSVFTISFVLLVFLSLVIIERTSGLDLLITALQQTKITKTFIIAVIIVIFVFISCVVMSYTHYGYPHSGDEIRLPGRFFNTNDVIYLG